MKKNVVVVLALAVLVLAGCSKKEVNINGIADLQ